MQARCGPLGLLLALGTALPASADSPAHGHGRPVSTYSIVAHDPAAGELGVAVQSHWFSVGSVVPWAEPGVGAVATQSFVEVSYGPLGLRAMREGTAPDEALAALLEKDEHPEVRQVALVDARSRAAAHTGTACIAGAGHRTGKGYSVQANLMLTDDVPEAMARAFEGASGPLAERMLAALDAAQAAGGDIRGKQSAAVVVVSDRPTEPPWRGWLVELRVEDHDHPLVELRRLLGLHRAYERMNRGDEAVAAGRLDQALIEYSAAEAMFPHNDEFVFWHAVALAGNGRLDEALPVFVRAFRMNPSWALVVPRLARAKHLPEAPGLVERILDVLPAVSVPRQEQRAGTP
jgi:uncharacterized Ntn-hydrolase superfamily protein